MSRTLAVCIIFCSFFLVSCSIFRGFSSKDPPEKVTVTIEAGPNINYYQDTPNPVVLRIYQLSRREEFQATNFWDIFSSSAKGLAGVVINENILSPVYPGEKRRIEVNLEPRSFFLGVFAEFSNPENQVFSDTCQITKKEKKVGMTVSVTRSGVAICPSQKDADLQKK